MVDFVSNLSSSFVLGLLTPLTAVCVLPLFPGFLAYLSNKLSGQPSKKYLIFFGLIISLGVVAFMFVLGLVFTTLLQASLTKVIGIVSPVAFGLLALISILLIFDIDIGRFLPRAKNPRVKNPFLSAFSFGFFFGAIVVPCNPLFISALFTRTLTSADFVLNNFNFLSFGIGISAPLLFFSLVSTALSGTIINFLVKYKKVINMIAGIIMLAISFYYLIFVFNVFDFLKQRETGEEMNIIGGANVQYLVDPDKIVSGGPPKDGIPSIDNPEFVSLDEADEWIEDNELVLALIYKGEKKVYPLQIMTWHEIVNDTVADDPILVTYCPLCGSGIAYERKINGEEVEFGTSGKLYNSNLVMYDRLTNSYWSQIDGVAILGELTGTELVPVSIDTVVWRDWKIVHPDSLILSQDTGFDRPYGSDPYGSYYEDSFVFFPVEGEDNRVHPKTVVFGIEVDGIFKAYKEEDLKKQNVIKDKIGETSVRVERDSVGVVKIINLGTSEEIVKERDFWFAWYAFHPDTLLYKPE